LSLADMDRYSAVTEYRFDWRTEREPSCDDIVFWRETGMKEEDVEDVEAREGACSMETAMLEVAETVGCNQRQRERLSQCYCRAASGNSRQRMAQARTKVDRGARNSKTRRPRFVEARARRGVSTFFVRADLQREGPSSETVTAWLQQLIRCLGVGEGAMQAGSSEKGRTDGRLVDLAWNGGWVGWVG
jgi:hypothetical protein